MDSYLTEERREELIKELESLRNVARLEVAEHLKRAKEYGDLSENSEYVEAREEQARIETRISEIDDMLKSAVIIKKNAGGGGLVQVGSTVTVKKGDKTTTYDIVGSNESDPMKNKISNESPMGRAFLGCAPGDTIEVDTPSGKARYTIVSVG
ncbi:MAG: transcription elongation factor GreA [Candidatus Liptonbacteria bacterium RIFCSPHIGHO2_01_FULL_57_28]|uniref:Transcription elongation factor GreA n=1 Tax=Candidatus Liptonbacteria bacterium RIFCSPHIGHO2_01_FULL_57_28 TaxID=1798647 RepID=A0A1G2CB79_9BACT|nr:MAG: transcription elongation factor GreA [Candidatus Liptonbacteria bacterium RIFCSPHIGHO2_01_FULL_57_28]